MKKSDDEPRDYDEYFEDIKNASGKEISHKRSIRT